MVKSPITPSLSDPSRSSLKADAVRDTRGADVRPYPLPSLSKSAYSPEGYGAESIRLEDGPDVLSSSHNGTSTLNTDGQGQQEKPDASAAASSQIENGNGEEAAAIDSEEKKAPVFNRFCSVLKDILLSSWVNALLIFVPVGIAVEAAGVSPTIVFAMNAIAIVPLAGLLSHATESVASEMGDTIGALMNVTFGNAVELIIL